MKLSFGEKTSAIARVLEDPKTTQVGDRKLTLVKVSDGEKIVNLMGWNEHAEKLKVKKGDIITVLDAFCPASHASGHAPPTLEAVSETKIEKTEMIFPTAEECMRTRFLKEAGDYEYVVCEGFIVRVDSITSRVCPACGRNTYEGCECGKEAVEKASIEGMFSDGTKAIGFSTISERAAESLGRTKEKKKLMEKPYRLLGYIRDDILYVEEALR